MLKISTGKFKKKTFSSSKDIRPTKSIVKEAFINMIKYCDLNKEDIFIDFFAGSGNISLELISNGYNGILIEKYKSIFENIKKNFQKLKIKFDKISFFELKKINDFSGNLIVFSDCFKILNFINPKSKVGFVFIDPPYDTNLGVKLLNNSKFINLINNNNSLIFFETSIKSYNKFNDKFKKYNILKEKKFGKTLLLLLKLNNEETL